MWISAGTNFNWSSSAFGSHVRWSSGMSSVNYVCKLVKKVQHCKTVDLFSELSACIWVYSRFGDPKSLVTMADNEASDLGLMRARATGLRAGVS